MSDLDKGRGQDRKDDKPDVDLANGPAGTGAPGQGDAKNDDKGGKDDKPKPKPKIVIYVNDHRYEVDEKAMTGAEVKALDKVPAEYQLFIEERGDDRQVRDDEDVKLRKEMKFYTLPPATFG